MSVVHLPVITRLNLQAEHVLQRALEADLESAVVLGWAKDGGLYFASSQADGGDVLWLLEKVKLALLNVDEELN